MNQQLWKLLVIVGWMGAVGFASASSATGSEQELKRYHAYWLRSLSPNKDSNGYEPMLLISRLPMVELGDHYQKTEGLRRMQELKSSKPQFLKGPADRRVELLDGIALVMETYEKDSIWNSDGLPIKHAESVSGVRPENHEAIVNGREYRYEDCPIAEVVRLLDKPEGTAPLHRIHGPLTGYAQTAKGLSLLLQQQMASDKKLASLDRRTRDFVSYLERHGMSLEYLRGPDAWAAEESRWSLKEWEVTIQSFPLLVREKWMRGVAGKPGPTSGLNPHARLAVSMVRQNHGEETPAQLKALAKKILDLLADYKPQPDPAEDQALADLAALQGHFRSNGLELRPVDHEGNISHLMFTVGPDHAKRMLIGAAYSPKSGARGGLESALPSIIHRHWRIYQIGGPGGNALPGFLDVWNKVEAALKSYTGPDDPKLKSYRPSIEESVWVEFPPGGYRFTPAEAAKGVKLEYTIEVLHDIAGVVALPHGPSAAQPAGPSGLYPREEISGSGQYFCLDDFGHAARPKGSAIHLKRGAYKHTMEWDGRNWTGPSDFGNPKGNLFPAGEYRFKIRLHGRMESQGATSPYQINGETNVKVSEK